MLASDEFVYSLLAQNGRADLSPTLLSGTRGDRAEASTMLAPAGASPSVSSLRAARPAMVGEEGFLSTLCSSVTDGTQRSLELEEDTVSILLILVQFCEQDARRADRFFQ